MAELHELHLALDEQLGHVQHVARHELGLVCEAQELGKLELFGRGDEQLPSFEEEQLNSSPASLPRLLNSSPNSRRPLLQQSPAQSHLPLVGLETRLFLDLG